MIVRPIMVDDREALESFWCGSRDQPGSRQVEQMIREELFEALGYCSTMGAWNDAGELRGVVAWVESPEEWRIAVLGVDCRSQGQGLGRRLKEHVIAQAAEAGAKRVASTVHGENQPMLRLNRSLGAATELDESGDYLDCTITVDPA